MANRAKPITQLPTLTAPAGEDLLVVVDDPFGTANTKKVSVTNLFNNTAVDITVAGNNTLSANTLVIRNIRTPANSTITVTQGTFFWDADYLYIATANNELKRVALSSF